MYKKLILIAAMTTIWVATGCGNKMWEDTKDVTVDTYDYVFDRTPTARTYHDEESIPIIKVNFQAADVLASHVSGDELTDNSPIYFDVFTNAEDPTDSSVFGLVMSQQVADRLVQKKIRLKKGSPKAQEYFQPQGVDMSKYENPVEYIGDDLPPRAAVLDGHYVVGDHYVYMTAKITRLDDKVIISGHNWTIPMSDNVRKMLARPMPDGGLTPTVKNKF